MPHNWSIYPKTSISQDLLDLANGDSLIARLLINRGVDSIELAKYFLDTENVTPSSPFEIPEMDKAIARVDRAIKNKEKILIYGDYDVDGTSSVALLYRAFGMIGIKVDYYVPDRAKEGYGINKEAVRKIKEDRKVDLMISCDCGISNYGEVEYANSIGLDVIITDHHSIPENPPPSIANCNPQTLPDNHPLHYLPGVGVAYKLAELILENHLDPVQAKAYSHSLLDLVALGMIADMAALKAENRYLTIEGLKVLAKSTKPGLQELLRASGVNTKVNSEHIGFGLAPRINAAGRLADALRAVKLMITEDHNEAQMLCLDLDTDNRERQALCSEIFEEALGMIMCEPEMLQDNCIVLHGENWHHGVIGIVASRILDKFHLPVFIMASHEGSAKGSVRCIDINDLDLYDEMVEIQKETNLFSKFGGHKMAAGFSCKLENSEKLIQAIRSHFRKRLDGQNLGKNLKVDTALKLKEINTAFINRLAKLAPYGIENPQPIFISGPLQIKSMRILGKEEKHLKLFLSEDNGRPYEAVLWNRAQEFIEDYGYGSKAQITIIYSPKINDFQGETSIQLDIKDWKRPEDVDDKFFERFMLTYSAS